MKKPFVFGAESIETIQKMIDDKSRELGSNWEADSLTISCATRRFSPHFIVASVIYKKLLGPGPDC